MLSRPRRYRLVHVSDGRWALEGECCICSEAHEAWGKCGHWELLQYRWSHRFMASDQARIWTARQQLLLDVAGPQRIRPKPVAA